jgi:hypothetical protein
MADDFRANVPSQGPNDGSPEGTGGVKPATSWLLPLVTAAVLASAFCLYYFVYVAAQREYLANRNFRFLAVLGDQIQAMVSIHGSILEFSADLADPTRNPQHWEKGDLTQFVVVRPEDRSKKPAERDWEALKDYVKYLAPSFELTKAAIRTQVRSPKPGSRSGLKVQRRNGRWELVLTAHTHKNSPKDSHNNYVGSLELSGALTPFVGSLPFDDILLVSEDGTIVYQSNKAGPQFTTLTGLLQAQVGSAETKPTDSAAETKPAGGTVDAHSGRASGHSDEETGGSASIQQNADHSWRTRSMHLTDVVLAGTRYKLFLQPVLVDTFTDEPNQEEPAQEFVLCGLISAKALEWQALSISSTFMVWLTALFLVIFMSGPVLKVLFINRREHLRLRELGFLGLLLVLVTSVLTLSGFNAVGYPLNDDTEEQLQRLGNNLSKNIHDEVQQMRFQLQAWCEDQRLQDDLKRAASLKSTQHDREIIRSFNSSSDPSFDPGVDGPPKALIYPYLNNVFWTDDDGQQIVKWSTSHYLTPMIDVSRTRLYTSPKSTYLDGTGPAFHFDSIMPPNKLEYLAALAISTGECNPQLLKSGIRGDVTRGSAFLTAQPLSLIDPILPLGYGFALFDETGLVLFHADKTKNIRENFLQESDWNKQLYAAAFGHSTQRSLTVKYLGKDYQARVMPVSGVSQAQLSLIVYRDLTSVRTLNLQAMTMASTLLLLILAAPATAIAIWSAIRRPQFAPEWLWPNQARTSTYVYQIVIYILLIILFLFLGFTGSSEQNIVACAAVPYTAFLLTAWCIRAYAPRGEKVPKRRVRRSHSLLAVVSILGAIVFLLIWRRAHLRAFTWLVCFGVIALLPLLDRPIRYLTMRLQRSAAREKICGGPEVGSSAWRRCYVLSVVLLLLLVGILTPMALFRASLNVERRLGIKQAQLHLASALDRRLMSTSERCEKQELGVDACNKFEGIEEKESEVDKEDKSTPWSRIVLDPRFLVDGKLRIVPRASPQQGGELYSGWFQDLIYALHHDYNQTAAEMLGVIPDRVDSQPEKSKDSDSTSSSSGTTGRMNVGSVQGADKKEPFRSLPEWSWDNEASALTLRWHGVHSLAPRSGEAPESQEISEKDLLITSNIPASSWGHAFAGAEVAAGVIVAMGFIVWALARRIFLFHVAPLKMTGALRAAESIREGRNVLILVPPVSDWHLEAQKYTIDVIKMATGPEWAEDFDLDTLPGNTVIEILHFEHSLNDAEIDNQKFILIQRLLERQNTQLAAIMKVPASSEDYGRMLPALELIDLREEPFYWLEQYEGPARDLIWKECGPMAALWPIGAQLANDIKTENIHSEETITSEVLERADGYYRLVWKECSDDQKFALVQLAGDGLLNPTNGRAIRQLVRKGLITTDPQFRLMNESFRRFLQSATSAGLKQEWLRESRRSGWGKVHGAFFTTMILLGAFLLTTQNALWQSSAAYVTTALGAFGTLVKLFNTYRSGGTTEKAG